MSFFARLYQKFPKGNRDSKIFLYFCSAKENLMRFKYLIASLMLCFSLSVFTQQKRAFLVGISHYDTALTGYQWNNINGVNDIELLSPILLNQGFQIVRLLDEEATYEAITKQLSQFIKKSKAGDIVYLHLERTSMLLLREVYAPFSVSSRSCGIGLSTEGYLHSLIGICCSPDRDKLITLKHHS